MILYVIILHNHLQTSIVYSSSRLRSEPPLKLEVDHLPESQKMFAKEICFPLYSNLDIERLCLMGRSSTVQMVEITATVLYPNVWLPKGRCVLYVLGAQASMLTTAEFLGFVCRNMSGITWICLRYLNPKSSLSGGSKGSSSGKISTFTSPGFETFGCIWIGASICQKKSSTVAVGLLTI